MLRRRLTREARRPPPAVASDSYDDVPYPGAAFPQTHPDRLVTLARLYGGEPRDVERCRVLELGCGDGGNLIPMAFVLPDASFVGFDLNAAAVEQGRRTIEKLGLGNIALHVGDITALDARSLGRCDHVIAHGVYSWVPEHVRAALLELCGACLEREGVAFVSFNALPGGHLRRAVRDVLRWEVGSVRDPSARIEAARDVLRRLQKRKAYDGEVGRELQRVIEAPDGVVYHDALASTNVDQSITGFVGEAAAVGLRYLCEAELHEGADAAPEAFAGELDGAGTDRLAREQLLDVLRLRLFRQALLVRTDSGAGEQLDPRGITALRAAASLRPIRKPRLDARAVDEFRGGKGGTLRIDAPIVKAALLVLGEVWPGSVPFGELAAVAAARLPGGQRDDGTLAVALLEAFRRQAIELHAWEPPAASRPGERPRASALARLQAAQGDTVATLRQRSVWLEDEQARRLVMLLDGTRDRQALAEAMGLDQRDARRLPERLEQLAALGLLET